MRVIPWDTLITGAVGVVGIGGTILAARMTNKTQTANLIRSITAENERTRLTEKRGIYACHLASCTEAVQAKFKWNTLKQMSTDIAFAMASDYAAKVASAITSAAEVRLIAPVEIADLADRVINVIPDYDPEAIRKRGDYDDVIRQLAHAMRADLGSPPSESF
jgi:hypothetical protein